MRITIEPTEDQSDWPVRNHSVSISHPSDELKFEDVLELMEAALIAWGFSPETVRQNQDEQ